MEVRILSRAFAIIFAIAIYYYGGYSLVVKLRSVKAAMRVRFPLVTPRENKLSEKLISCCGIKGFVHF